MRYVLHSFFFLFELEMNSEKKNEAVNEATGAQKFLHMGRRHKAPLDGSPAQWAHSD